MRREQKTKELGCPCKGMVETESNKGVRSIAPLDNVGENGVGDLLERVLDRDNLNAAYKRVKKNGGAAGVDGMTVDDMFPYLAEHKDELISSIREGRYNPQPVRRVEIPKPDGGKRLLGVPTVIDRMIQQAIVQILQPIFEKTFSDNSYGFRPKRNTQQAIKKAKGYYEAGHKRVVDIDLAKYFDTVNHDLLVGMLREKIQDERIIALIRKYLKSGVMINGVKSATEEGTPQGGNLSPLLSNIYLTGFDRMLEGRGHKFVRYADDCNIYVKSQRAAERVMLSCTRYLEGTLKLKVNQEKSKTGSPLKLKFLGFALYKTGKKTGIRAHEKSIKRFKDKAREITSRSRGRAIEQVLRELKVYTTGWLGYYAAADLGNKIQELNQWIRRRIRMYLWKQWKRIKTRYENLVKFGLSKNDALKWAKTSKGYWRISGSPILSRTLTNEYLASMGYDDISKKYEVLHLNH